MFIHVVVLDLQTWWSKFEAKRHIAERLSRNLHTIYTSKNVISRD